MAGQEELGRPLRLQARVYHRRCLVQRLLLPLLSFLELGLEHSVANMFLLPFGMMQGADLTTKLIVDNLIPVTLGNLLGGALFVAGFYHNAYGKK